MIENDFADRMVLLALVIGILCFVVPVLWRAIKNDTSNQLYRIIYKDKVTYTWRTHASGLTFAEAHEQVSALEIDLDMQYRVVHDTFDT